MTDRARLSRLLQLAEVAADRSRAKVGALRLKEAELAGNLADLEAPLACDPNHYDPFLASGAAAMWTQNARQRTRHLRVLAGRARLATQAAMRDHSRAEARRLALQKLLDSQAQTRT